MDPEALRQAPEHVRDEWARLKSAYATVELALTLAVEELAAAGRPLAVDGFVAQAAAIRESG